MKTYLPILGLLIAGVLSGSFSFADPWSPSCADAIGQLRRAQKTVHVKQVEVRKVERGERVQVQRVEVCKPGGIIVAGRVAECVQLSREVPIAIQELSEAKADRQPALD